MKDLRQRIINNPIEEIKTILWGSNQKIGAIPSLIGESPIDCSSKKRGFCNICKECYAISDYKQYKSHRERVDKSIAFFELIKEDKTIYALFERVLNYFDITSIRYNLEGDFKNKSDILFLKEFAKANPQIKVYGYSKRRDLKEDLEDVLKLNNFYCGVNFECKGANQFITTSYIFDYMKAPLKCLGDCNKCQKCFNLKNKDIYCFIHGSPSKIQSKLNTPQNWEDMAIIIKQYKVDYSVRR